MSDTRYLAGDLSGIQRFVLRVKSAGQAQAKRLRARSLLLVRAITETCSRNSPAETRSPALRPDGR